MLVDGMSQQITNVRRRAEQLVTQLNADPMLATPFLEAVTAFEHFLQATLDPAQSTPSTSEHSIVRSPGAADEQDNGTNALRQAEAQSAQLHYVLTHAPIGICILDGPEHRFTFTNPSYDQLAGRTDLLGKTVREVFPEIAGQGIYELIDQVYTTGVAFTASDLLIQMDRQGDGRLEDVYFELTYAPVRTADGTITGVIDYVTEINDRRALQQERERTLQLMQAAQHTAEAERQRLLEVLHQVPAAICTLEGPEHVFTFTNPRYNQLVGHQHLIGQPVRAVLPEVEGQGFFELLDQVYTTGVPFNANEAAVQLYSQGTGVLEETFVNFVYAPLRDASNHIIGIFAHIVDITETVIARQQVEAALVVRDQFLAVAAHELKTPLTSLLGYVQLLQRRLARTDASDERTDRTLAMLGTQGTRLTRLVDTLLDVSRMSTGQLSLEQLPLDLGALTASIVKEVALTLRQQAIDVTVPATPCIVFGDSLRLEQVLVNLLQNASKYSPPTGAITIAVGCENTRAWVRVCDQGMGIPAVSLPHLFERFYRVPDTDVQAINGMGIGLSVVKDIVALHGGTVSVESTEGSGSTFTVHLPLMHASDVPSSV